MAYCFTCGGQGLKDKDCPECGKSLKPLLDDVLPKNEDIQISADSNIPRSYMGIDWLQEMLLRDYTELDKDLNFKRFVESLGKINNIFRTGMVPAKSFLIIAPPRFSKMIFAYSCMQYALAYGFSVAPILDTLEVKRLIALSAENPRYKLYDRISYDSYINSDVLFLTVTKTDYCIDSYSTILEILDKRTRLGKFTGIISRFDMKTMSRRDYNHHFDKILDYSGNNNDLKYPAIISYKFLGGKK